MADIMTQIAEAQQQVAATPGQWRSPGAGVGIGRPFSGDLTGAPSLSATIVAHPDRHSTILTAHLPDLLSTWDSEPEWWFIRHHDPEHHLRLRIRIPTADGFGRRTARGGLVATSSTARPRRAATVRDLLPETGRFGVDAMTATESVFAAD